MNWKECKKSPYLNKNLIQSRYYHLSHFKLPLNFEPQLSLIQLLLWQFLAKKKTTGKLFLNTDDTSRNLSSYVDNNILLGFYVSLSPPIPPHMFFSRQIESCFRGKYIFCQSYIYITKNTIVIHTRL